MANNITPEMIALLNSGNKAELRAFLKLYTRPVYERALAITKSEEDAIRVTRRVTSEVSVLALRGKLEEDIDAQLMALTDACCSEDMFFARLVEDTLRDYPEEKNEQPTLFGKAVKPNWPAKQPSVVERGSAAITASAPKSKTDGEPVTAAASAYTAPAAESSQSSDSAAESLAGNRYACAGVGAGGQAYVSWHIAKGGLWLCGVVQRASVQAVLGRAEEPYTYIIMKRR